MSDMNSVPAPAPPTQQPRRKLGTGAIIGIAGGGVAVLVVLALVIAFAVVPRSGPSAAANPGGPSDVVRTFLTALSKSDAKSALAQIDNVRDRTYLTDRMLRASNKAAPLHGIVVGKNTDSTSYSAKVEAIYSVGSKKFTTSFSLLKSKDAWHMGDPTSAIFANFYTPLGLTLNGIPVDGKTIRVFPGSYTLALTQPNFRLEGDTTVLIGTADSVSPTATAKLTESAVATFRELVKKDVDACVASRSLEPGCGMKVAETSSDGTRVIDGTLTRTLSASTPAKLAALEPQYFGATPLVVRTGIVGAMDTTGDCEKDGKRSACRLLGGETIRSARVDFSTTTPTLSWDPTN